MYRFIEFTNTSINLPRNNDSLTRDLLTGKMPVLSDCWELGEPPTIRYDLGRVCKALGGACGGRTTLRRCVRWVYFQNEHLIRI